MSDKKFILKVGKRGEIYTTAELRKLANIEPGGEVIAVVSGRKIILSPKPSALSLLKKPYLTPPISIEEIKENRKEVAKWLKER